MLVGAPHELLGVLSERDVVDVVAHRRDADGALVRDAITAPAVHIDVEDTLLDAAVLAVDLGARHPPVVDAGRVVGIVSVRDLVPPSLLDALTGADAA